MKAPASLTPSKLRILLSAALVAVIIAGGVLLYFVYNKLGQTAEETGSQVATAREGQNTLQRLQNLQQELDDRRDEINRASQVMANSQNYAYQDRLVSDLTVYANRANLSISNISFSGQGGSTGGTAAPSGGGAPTAAPGLKSTTVDVTLENPVNYRNLLNFLHYVEQNLTKLKVSKVTMTKSEGSSVTVDVLSLEVYVR